MIVGGASLAAIEFPFVAMASTGLKLAVAMVASAVHKAFGCQSHDGSP